MGKRVTKKQVRPGKAILSAFIPDGEIEAIDAYGRRIAEQNPGMRVTRTDAVRMLYTIGLHAVGMSTEKGSAVSS